MAFEEPSQPLRRDEVEEKVLETIPIAMKSHLTHQEGQRPRRILFTEVLLSETVRKKCRMFWIILKRLST